MPHDVAFGVGLAIVAFALLFGVYAEPRRPLPRRRRPSTTPRLLIVVAAIAELMRPGFLRSVLRQAQDRRRR